MALARFGWLLTGAACIVPLASLWTSPEVPLTLHLMPVVILAVTAAAPVAGLATLALLGPLAEPLQQWLGAPGMGGSAMLQVLVLPTLAGLCAGRGLRPRNVTHASGHVAAWAWVLGTVIAASALVVVSVQPEVFAAGSTGAGYLWAHLTGHYFTSQGDVAALDQAILWLESLGLAGLVAHEIRRHPPAGPLLAGLALLGLTACAYFSWQRLGAIAVRDAAPIAASVRHLFSTRISPHLSDINAMGSMFALVTAGWATWLLAPATPRRWRIAAACGAVISAGALWMTHSRAALFAALLVSTIAWLRLRRPSARLVVALALAAASLVTFTLAAGVIRVPRATARTAAEIRFGLTAVGLRMVADHPWFGVGLGQFQRRAPEYTSQDLIAIFPQSGRGENAHNQFVQVLSELGAVGLLAFVGYWVSLFRPLVSRTRAPPISPPLAACTAGLTAFLVSALLGHPFLIPLATLTTFFVVGVVAGLAPAPATGPAGTRRRWVPAVAIAMAIVATVPFRIAAARQGVSLDNVVVGATVIVGERDGIRYRTADAHSVWLVRADARILEIPLRADHGQGCRVSLAVDGRAADEVRITADRWQRARFTFPEPETRWRTRRIEITTSIADCALLVGRPVVID